MSPEKVPNWKFWDPLSAWWMLTIFAIGQVVGQFGIGLPLRGLVSGDTGMMVGAAIGGAVAHGVVLLLAKRKKAKIAHEAHNR